MKTCCNSAHCNTSQDITMITLVELLESKDTASIEAMRQKINDNQELRHQLTTEVGGHFLSCIALSELFSLPLDEFMNEFSPEHMQELGDDEDEDSEEDEYDDEDDCCGTC